VVDVGTTFLLADIPAVPAFGSQPASINGGIPPQQAINYTTVPLRIVFSTHAMCHRLMLLTSNSNHPTICRLLHGTLGQQRQWP
jgi:hypothetical protein